MEIETLIRRRVLTVNGQEHAISKIEDMRPGPKGGLHFKLSFPLGKFRVLDRPIYIPEMLLSDLENEKPNKQLDAQFRL